MFLHKLLWHFEDCSCSNMTAIQFGSGSSWGSCLRKASSRPPPYTENWVKGKSWMDVFSSYTIYMLWMEPHPQQTAAGTQLLFFSFYSTSWQHGSRLSLYAGVLYTHVFSQCLQSLDSVSSVYFELFVLLLIFKLHCVVYTVMCPCPHLDWIIGMYPYISF